MFVEAVNLLSRFIDPETIHHWSMKGLKFVPQKELQNKVVQGSSLLWNNKIGLAAGFDKNAEYLDVLSKLGFGAIEIGTVTPRPQRGNKRPRIKKIYNHKSILNWMGFPGKGMIEVKSNLEKYTGQLPIGINIGKNKDTPLEKAIEDYISVAECLRSFASYMVINVSSPNTQGLRSLQNKNFLDSLLTEFLNRNLPNIFIKLSPDISDKSCFQIVDLVQNHQVGGIIATNTSSQHSYQKGGISGRDLFEKSNSLIKKICKYAPDRSFDLVACGGIESIDQIEEYEELNVNFFQIYSSFVYNGPQIIQTLTNKKR